MKVDGVFTIDFRFREALRRSNGAQAPAPETIPRRARTSTPHPVRPASGRRRSLRFHDQVPQRALGRCIFERERLAERQLDDYARLQRNRSAANERHTLALDHDHDLGKVLLHVRPHAAARSELAREHGTERRKNPRVAQIPDQHAAVAPEQALATIMRQGTVPHHSSAILAPGWFTEQVQPFEFTLQ